MTVNTSSVVTFGTEMAGCHSSHYLQHHSLLFSKLIVMGMIAIRVGAVA